MNTGETLIKVENLSKKFCRKLSRSMYYGMIDAGRNMIGIPYDTNKLRKDEFWALKDVNFELKKGETLGIIGTNGSGKSTLLRLLTGIYPPDSGKITTKGRIGALIAVGAGFHPHMTGRENIYLNGTILGMSRDEIKKHLDEIIDFAEIGEFIDSPVATYSSGMTVRLGFSVAIHCEPDILLVDEIMAVGDLNFQLKCHKYLTKYRKERGATILISHNNQLIQNVCNHALLLSNGIVEKYDTVESVIQFYEDKLILTNKQNNKLKITQNSDKINIKTVTLSDENDNEKDVFLIGDKIKLKIFYTINKILEKPIIGISIHDMKETLITANYSDLDNASVESFANNGYIEYIINNVSLQKGKYSFSFTISESEISNVALWIENAIEFKVIGNSVFKGIVSMNHDWNL